MGHFLGVEKGLINSYTLELGPGTMDMGWDYEYGLGDRRSRWSISCGKPRAVTAKNVNC